MKRAASSSTTSNAIRPTPILPGVRLTLYVCGRCGAVRDPFDPIRYGHVDEDGGKARQRWCHNYAAHKDGGKRKMDLISAEVVR